MGLGNCRGLRHIKAMKKTDPQATASTASSTPPADATPRSRFTEHRAQPTPSNSAAKSAKITADSKPVAASDAAPKKQPKEIGGPKGPEPTRYGDWERDGRCVDF